MSSDWDPVVLDLTRLQSATGVANGGANAVLMVGHNASGADNSCLIPLI